MCKKLAYLISSVVVLALADGASAGLVGHWTFDEGSGTVAADSSGNGNDGTVMGDAAWVAGRMGGSALNFDLSDDIVIIDDDPSLDVEDALTISLWVNTPEVVVPNHMVTKQPSGTAPDNFPGNYEFRVKDNTIQFLHQTSESTDYSEYHSTTQITAGEWHHAVVSVKESGFVEFYLDGVSAGSLPQLGAFGVLNDDSLRIGGRKDSRFFNGILDDVYIYSRALNLDQIVALGEGIEPTFRKAEDPSIPDNSLFENTWANVEWTPGDVAVSHDVYIGDNFEDVNDGTEETFLGNQASTSFLLGFPGFAIPNGLVPGTTYYWRIDEVNPDYPESPWKGDIWSFAIPPNTAYNPHPADGFGFVDAQTTLDWMAGLNAKGHHAYFGDSYDDVSHAAGAIMQMETTYDPGPLEMDKTYYWRVDEFDGVEMQRGNVWSFTTVPDVPAQSTDPNLVGWWKLDEGRYATALDVSGNNRHGSIQGDLQWADGFELSALELDGVGDYVNIDGYKGVTAIDGVQQPFTITCWIKTTGSGEMVTWGSSPARQRIAFRIDGGTLRTEHGSGNLRGNTSVNDGRWHHVAIVVTEGAALWTPQTSLYVDGRADSTFSGSDNTYNLTAGPDVCIGCRADDKSRFFPGSIDDVRIYDKTLTAEEIQQVMLGDPKLAGSPVPQRGVIVDIRDAGSLNWSAGDTTASHDVYFGTDRDAVAGADNSAPEFKGNQAGTSLSLAGLVEFGGGDYYWRVDEIAADGTVIAGTIWKFTVPDYLIVDNFESYDNIDPAPGEPGVNRMFDKWIDGYANPLINGAIVGNPMPPYAEQVIVHSGSQSMNYNYDNAGKTSEATLTLTKRDWTAEGVTKLSLWVRGNSANAADRIFIALNGTAVVYHDDPAAPQLFGWNEWVIDLAAFGVGLTNVNSITIGIGTKNTPAPDGGAGTVYFDDIRLVR